MSNRNHLLRYVCIKLLLIRIYQYSVLFMHNFNNAESFLKSLMFTSCVDLIGFHSSIPGSGRNLRSDLTNVDENWNSPGMILLT